MSINDQLLLQKEYNISAEEVFFLRLLFLAQPEEDKSKYIGDYFKLKSRGNPKEMLIHFKEVGIINKSYKIPEKNERFYPENIEFNHNFFKRYLAYSGDLGFELWDSYPNLLHINNKDFTAKNIGKKFNSREEFFFAYGKAIKFNVKLHEEVLELLEWAKSNKLINCGITEYVISHQWETHAKLRDEGFDGNTLEIDELI